MCGHNACHIGHGYGWGCCGSGWEQCGPPHHFGWRYPTREERLAQLEQYLQNLQAEARAVQERIEELKTAG